MAEVITNHGEALIAEKIGNQEILDADTVILSYDPDINPDDPIDRDTGLPEADLIVYQDAVTQNGYVNPNQVVYSLFMDNTVGSFQFNRMDLVASADDNTNIAIATFPTQNKIAENPDDGIRGQSMTRNFMTVYDGAQSVTNITVEAAVWQIDFMARLHSSDELERTSTRDTYGRGCFWQDAFQVINNDGQYQYLPGTAYVEGIRLSRVNATDIDPGILPKNVWLDVSLQGNLNGVSAFIESVFSTSDQSDYTDSNGIEHYLEKIAEISSGGVVTDTRRSVDILDHILDYLVPEAPNDGQPYVRQSLDWMAMIAFQPGMIMIWAGNEEQIPEGWQLCNGKGKTSNDISIPNLLNRMVIGSGDNYDSGDKGGSTSATTSNDGQHSHITEVDPTTLSTSQMPSHNHSSNESYQVGGSVGAGWLYQSLVAGGDVRASTSNRTVTSAGGSKSHIHSARTYDDGEHEHIVDTLPPYYALAYIIKL